MKWKQIWVLFHMLQLLSSNSIQKLVTNTMNTKNVIEATTKQELKICCGDKTYGELWLFWKTDRNSQETSC